MGVRVVRWLMLTAPFGLAGCGAALGSNGCLLPPAANAIAATPASSVAAPPIRAVRKQVVRAYAAPWAMAFLPDGRLLVTERPSGSGEPGRLSLATQGGRSSPITGLPRNEGVLDVALHPDFARNHLFFISFLEPGAAGEERFGRGKDDHALHPLGLAVAVARLSSDASGVRLQRTRIVWRQHPKVVSAPGSGEPGGRMAVSPGGRHLFVSAGDRQEFEPVQELSNTLGKIVRLNIDGSVPADNPFARTRGARPEIWSLGHRNPYGLAFDARGRLWSHEMGPAGGDELNLVRPCQNYGWPAVSDGDHYDGGKVPRPRRGDGFAMPALSWTPVIAPAGMIVYSGSAFPAWRGSAIVTGLQSMGLVRVKLTGDRVVEEQRIDLGARIREVEQGPDGALWVLEDAPSGRLIRLMPAA